MNSIGVRSRAAWITAVRFPSLSKGTFLARAFRRNECSLQYTPKGNPRTPPFEQEK